MKKFLSCTKTAIIFLILTLIVIGAYTYMLARPISYGMEYYNKTEYATRNFEYDKVATTIHLRGIMLWSKVWQDSVDVK